MWFKNLKIYRLSPQHKLSAQYLDLALSEARFRVCGSQESQISGWIEPREGFPLVYQQPGQMLIQLRTERRLLPAPLPRWPAITRRRPSHGFGRFAGLARVGSFACRPFSDSAQVGVGPESLCR